MTRQNQPGAWLAAPAQRPNGWDMIVAVGLFSVTLSMLLLTDRLVGVARDEGIYVNAAEVYQRYVEEVAKHPERRRDKRTIAKYYHVNSEHPPATKHLYGLSWRLLHQCNCHRTHPHGRAITQKKAPHGTSWGLLPDLTALRFPALCIASLLVAFIYLFGTIAFGRFAGLTAALAYVVIPRVFFHSHLAGLDAPITAAMFITVYAYYRALHSWRWTVATGLVFGLALLTKFNAFFLPVILLVHYAWASRRDFRHPWLAVTGIGSLLPLVLLSLAALVTGKGPGWYWIAGLSVAGLLLLRRELFSRPLRAASLLAPAVFFSMLLLGGAVLVLQWPWLWHDTAARFSGYLNYHLQHTFYNTEYFGKNYNLPPFPVSYPFVLSLFTLPLTFLLAALGGLWLALDGPVAALRGWLRKEPPPAAGPDDDPGRRWGRPLLGLERSPAFLVSVNALFPILLIALPSTPIFGGARLWMPAWPYLALLAGWGAQQLWLACRPLVPGRIWRGALAAGLVGALITPPLVQLVRAGDVAPALYAPVAGGTAGAADMGLKRQYWGFATRRLLPTLNRMARPKAKSTRVPVYFHDTNHFSRNLYARNGLLSPNVTFAGDGYRGIGSSQIALFLHEKHQVIWEYLIWQDYGTVQPDHVLTLDGVPLITVYKRHGRPCLEPPFFEDPPGFRLCTRRRGRFEKR